MKKQPLAFAISDVAAASLADRGAEALRLGRFRDAIEAFKQALRQDPQPQWRDALGQAYAGRARDLAAKGMYKEAAIVLENTRAADGTVAAPLLYLRCLIRQGQLSRAVQAARSHLAGRTAAPGDEAGEAGRLAELAAALALAVPGAAAPAPGAWTALCQNAVQALQAWREDAPPDTVERFLAALPLRSVFGPLRLTLKALITGRAEPEKAARLLAMVPTDNVFSRFAAAAAMALSPDTAALLAGWGRLSPAQQGFVAAARGLPATAADRLGQILEAEQRGPAALLSVLLRQSATLPHADLRAACVELLIQVPEQLTQVERTFGPLSDFERHRVLALAGELKQDWRKAKQHWLSLAETLGRQTDPEARLAQGVVYRHLADLTKEWQSGPGEGEDPEAEFLERSLAVDPAHLPTTLRLIVRYRDSGQSQRWYRAVDRAMQTFPADSAVLAQAVDAAVARKSYKKAAGFARKLLALDPINQAVRQQMIALQIAQARKQMQATRPDLAWKALADAAEWQRVDAPDAGILLAQALVGSRLGQGAAETEKRLQEGVRLAGGGVVGWFHAALEAALMGAGESCGVALDQAARTPPEREAILALIALLGRSSDSQAAPAVSVRALGPLVARIEPWLRAGAGLAWSVAEFLLVAEQLQRFRLFNTLLSYARQALERAPQDGTARFFAIVAAVQADPRRLTVDQEETLDELEEQAATRQDFRAAKRIRAFLDPPVRGGRPGKLTDGLDAETLQELLDTALDHLPGILPHKEIRRMLNDLGRAGTVDLIDDMLHDSPFSVILTPPQIRQLAERTVVHALAPGGRR